MKFEPIKLTLPYPPSLNNLYSTGKHGKRFLTAKGRNYKSVVGKIAENAQKLDGEIKLTVDVFRPAKRGDLDNTLKILQDSLEGICYHNDRQVVEIHARRFDDKNNPRAEIEIIKLESADPTFWD